MIQMVHFFPIMYHFPSKKWLELVFYKLEIKFKKFPENQAQDPDLVFSISVAVDDVFVLIMKSSIHVPVILLSWIHCFN